MSKIVKLTQDYKVSVVMAAYNGELYIREQIDSILSELSTQDILYIADDCSSDSTLKIIESLADSRIKIIRNKINLGYVANFNMLVNLIDTDYIFFSDQDDIWVKGRLRLMIEASLVSQKNVIFGRFNLLNKSSENFLDSSNDKVKVNYNENFLINIIRLFFGIREYTYFGSTLMITNKAKKYLFPLIDFKMSHDVWIAIMSNLKKDVFHLEDVVTYRRLHGSNLTNHTRCFISKFLTRVNWINTLIRYAFR